MINQRTSVITINYHGAVDTATCVASLVESTVPLAIVVVDNTPNDPELEAALAPFPQVTLLRASENLGFGRGNNLGIEWALNSTNCEFIFIFNNDATVEAHTVQVLEQALDGHPESGIVSPRIVLAEEPNKLWYGGGEVDWKRGGGKVPGVLGAADAPLAILPRYVTFASGCAMMMRRSIIEKIAGFDQRFFMYEEDLELSLRMQESGWKIWYEPKALVRHVGQGSQKKQDEFMVLFHPKNPNLPFYAYHVVKNRLLNMWMHAYGKNWLIFVSVFPVFISIKLIQWLMHGRLGAVKNVMKAVRDYRNEKSEGA